AGIAPLRDHRGETDRYGNELRLTQVAVVDQLAAAAELVKGKRDQIPVAVVRGLPVAATAGDDGPGVVATLVRDAAHDMFSLGTAEARAAGLREAATLADDHATGPAPVGAAEVRAAVRAAIATVAGHGSGSLLSLPEPDGGDDRPVVRCTAAEPGDPEALVRLGSDAHRLRSALAATGLGSTARFEPPGTVLVRVVASGAGRR
ncbi:MAG: F420-0--gamma-glutamyl ligase, partial [Micromonosporaceae bacterium]|nr:F420-0--gamma-glutamyl ligase [Micromonosporaceae bacterium]